MKIVAFKGKPYLALFAIKDINVYDEVLYNYGTVNLPWENKVN